MPSLIMSVRSGIFTRDANKSHMLIEPGIADCFVYFRLAGKRSGWSVLCIHHANARVDKSMSMWEKIASANSHQGF